MENEQEELEPGAGMDSEPTFTELLAQLGGGALENGRELDLNGQMFELVYGQLRAIARRQMRTEPAEHTLQPTALVHEAWVKLFSSAERSWQNRQHFLGFAARAMRSILVDHARKKARLKREPGGERVPLGSILDEFEPGGDGAQPQLIEIDALLTRLGSFDEGLVRLVELRFFLGLSMSEVARMRGVSKRTIERDWVFAKAWIKRALEDHRRRESEDGAPTD